MGNTTNSSINYGAYKGDKFDETNHPWVSPDEKKLDRDSSFGLSIPISNMHYSEKFCNAEGGDYRGRIGFTKSGAICQRWAVDNPTVHTYKPSQFSSLKEVRSITRPNNIFNDNDKELQIDNNHNYCRTITKIPTAVQSEGGKTTDYGTWNNTKKNDGALIDETDTQRPWCIAATDRKGATFKYKSETTLFGNYTIDNNKYKKHPDLARYTKGKNEYNLFGAVEKDGSQNTTNIKGVDTRMKNFMAQRCIVGSDTYQPWDCINASNYKDVNNNNKNQNHGISHNSKLINSGTYEVVDSISTSGGDLLGGPNIFNEGTSGWKAEPKKRNNEDSLNYQEHWIKIVLKDKIQIEEIQIVDLFNDKTSAPIQIYTFADSIIKETYQQLGYNKIDYIDETSKSKGIIQKFPTGSALSIREEFKHQNYKDKETKIILITFPRFKKFNNEFGLKQISIVRRFNNYELNYNISNKKWELFNYSNVKTDVIGDNPPKTVPYGNAYSLLFKSSQHFSCKYKLEVKSFSRFNKDETITEINPILMISCWFKVDRTVETNSKRVLVCDDSGLFMPCVIDSDQNRLGCEINNEFIYSGINIGELKKGWHHIALFCTQENIYYYINGLNPNNMKTDKNKKYSGICNITSKTVNNKNIYIIGNSIEKSNPWGYISNLNIYCCWNKRKNDEQSLRTPISFEDSEDDFFSKVHGFVNSMWKKGSDNWNYYTCPDHSKNIKQAVNTAKSRAVSANRHKLDRLKDDFRKSIKYEVQNAEDKAYEEILDYVSKNNNVIIWNNVNVTGKKVQLTVNKGQKTDLEISNIQIYGNYNNQPSKNWVVDEDTTIDLSSQPNTDFIMDIDKTRVDKSTKSDAKPNAKATIACKPNEYMVSCKCFSTDESCKGASLKLNTEQYEYTGKKQKRYLCEATNNSIGQGVHAQVQCARFTNNNLPENTFEIVTDDNNEANDISEVSCPSGSDNKKSSPYYMINCSCQSDDNSYAQCSNSEISIVDSSTQDSTNKKTVCRAYPKKAGHKVKAQALCMKIPGDPTLPNISQKIAKSHPKQNERSEAKDGSTAIASCPESYTLIDGDCTSDLGTNSCDSSRINPEKNEVTSYNSRYGGGVSASANCMKFNIIDDNCKDNNLGTRCATGSNSKNPTITFTFDKLINIEKIVIYNRDDNKNNNIPLHINIIDNYDHIIMTGVKESYDHPMKITNKPPEPPDGCKGYDELNITDKGYALINNKPAFRQWADVRGIGKKCDYCRITGSKDTKMISCALGNNTFNQYAYNSNAGLKDHVINPNTQYMYPESNDSKDDFCYLNDTSTDGRSNIECLKNTPTGFGEVFKPSDQDVSYAGLTGDQILANRKPLDTSRCMMNTFEDNYTNNSVDAGFYWPNMKKYYLFKNSILDSTSMVIFKEFNAIDDSTNMAPLIMNVNNWPGVNFDKIDATLFLDVNPFRPDNKDQQLVFFFSNKMCVAYDLVQDKVIRLSSSQSRNSTIADYFPHLPKCGFDTIDSACYLGDGICYFFKNNQFIIYDLNNIMTPCNSSSSKNYISQTPTFSKLPFTSGIDSAICFYNPSNVLNKGDTTILFFKNEQYIEWNLNTNLVNNDTGANYNIQPSFNINENENYVNIWKIELDESFSRVRTIYNLVDSKQLIKIPLTRSENIAEQFKRPSKLSNKEYTKCLNDKYSNM